MKVAESFLVHGKVQGIMFRQTFVRALLTRGLLGGATNNRLNQNEVSCSVEGEEEVLKELKNKLLTLDSLNSWGAKVEEIIPCDYIPYQKCEVTTENVESKKWTPGVEFYL